MNDSRPILSFIIPAHNEEEWISRSISAVRNAMLSVGEPYEIIVVDDASTDATAALALKEGARVLRVEHRHIAATRNSGARAAVGDFLFFVDADTLVNGPLIQSALRSLRAGALGGGGVPRFEGRLPLWSKLLYPFFAWGMRVTRLTGGACQFCTRSAFEQIQGYSLEHYAAEDVVFLRALKRHGRLVVPRQTVITSGRKLRSHSFRHIGPLMWRLLRFGPATFRSRQGLDLWYERKRDNP